MTETKQVQRKLTGGTTINKDKARELARRSCRELARQANRVVSTVKSTPESKPASEEEIKHRRIQELSRSVVQYDARLKLLLRTAKSRASGSDVNDLRRNFAKKSADVREAYERILDKHDRLKRELDELEDPGCTERKRAAKKRRSENRRVSAPRSHLTSCPKPTFLALTLNKARTLPGSLTPVRVEPPLPPVPKRPTVVVEIPDSPPAECWTTPPTPEGYISESERAPFQPKTLPTPTTELLFPFSTKNLSPAQLRAVRRRFKTTPVPPTKETERVVSKPTPLPKLNVSSLPEIEEPIVLDSPTFADLIPDWIFDE